jgi:hypothetical protein
MVSDVKPRTGTPAGIEDVGRGNTASNECNSQSSTTWALSVLAGRVDEVPSLDAMDASPEGGARLTEDVRSMVTDRSAQARHGMDMGTLL